MLIYWLISNWLGKTFVESLEMEGEIIFSSFWDDELWPKVFIVGWARLSRSDLSNSMLKSLKYYKTRLKQNLTSSIGGHKKRHEINTCNHKFSPMKIGLPSMFSSFRQINKKFYCYFSIPFKPQNSLTL